MGLVDAVPCVDKRLAEVCGGVVNELVHRRAANVEWRGVGGVNNYWNCP